jgi:hypothetical protein
VELIEAPLDRVEVLEHPSANVSRQRGAPDAWSEGGEPVDTEQLSAPVDVEVRRRVVARENMYMEDAIAT